MAKKIPKNIKEILDHYGQYLNGYCNCPACRSKRTDKAASDLFKEVYPALPFVPRRLNKHNNYDTNGLMRRLTAGERPVQIYTELVELRDKNNRIRKKLIKGGSTTGDRTFCAQCGTIMNKKDGHATRLVIGKAKTKEDCHVCADCVRDYFSKCDDCGKVQRKGEFYQVFKNMEYYDAYHRGEDVPEEAWVHVCTVCARENYGTCSACGVRITNDGLTDLSHLSIRRGNRNTYCIRCVKEKVKKCPECGDDYLYHEGKNMAIGERVARVCFTCFNDTVAIKSHDYRPAKFRKLVSAHEGKIVPEDKLLYGFEIEIENMGTYDKRRGCYRPMYDREKLARKVQDWLNDRFGRNTAYIVHDGTLKAGNEVGIEIVTQPVSWLKYKEDKNKYTDLLNQLRAWGCQAFRPGTAGFHVHMSKSAFTRLHLYKFVDFLYKRSVADFRQAIAQRKGNRYSSFNNVDMTNTKKIAKDKYNPSGTHYAAINLTNPDTVEVRIFRGVLEPLHFHKNIEFLHALYRFARDSRLQDMVVYNFVKYITETKNEYRCLIDFIKQDVNINKRYTSVQKLLKGI